MMALAGVVLSYCCSFISVQVLDGAGWLPRPAVQILAVIYRPLSWYVTESDLPGAKGFASLAHAAHTFGSTHRQ